MMTSWKGKYIYFHHWLEYLNKYSQRTSSVQYKTEFPDIMYITKLNAPRLHLPLWQLSDH